MLDGQGDWHANRGSKVAASFQPDGVPQLHSQFVSPGTDVVNAVTETVMASLTLPAGSLQVGSYIAHSAFWNIVHPGLLLAGSLTPKITFRARTTAGAGSNLVVASIQIAPDTNTPFEGVRLDYEWMIHSGVSLQTSMHRWTVGKSNFFDNPATATLRPATVYQGGQGELAGWFNSGPFVITFTAQHEFAGDILPASLNLFEVFTSVYQVPRGPMAVA